MCTVCKHPERAEIEQALMAGATRASLEHLAERFSVDIEKLKTHALFHMSLVDFRDEEPEAHSSLVRQMKLKEADMLDVVSCEYLVTLKALGRRINRLIELGDTPGEEDDKQFKVAKMLSKPMVDLYIGLGGEIRQTIRTSAEIDRMLNGPQDSGAAGLAALAAALKGSE